MRNESKATGTASSSYKFIALLFSIACFSVHINAVQADLTPTLLQTCIEECQEEGFCCGNRLNGEAPTTSNNRLSCANGCEIAYYSKDVAECQSYCEEGNDEGCEWKHPLIEMVFKKCRDCQEGCPGWPAAEACSTGCDKAQSIDGFYCADDESWGYKGDKSKSCSGWVSENTKKRCKKKDSGKKVWDICPETCKCEADTCKNCAVDCSDDSSFQYDNDPTKTCKDWVKKKKSSRCKKEGVSEGCPSTCKTVRKLGDCGSGGRKVEVCEKKKWKDMGCLEYDPFSIVAGFHPGDLIRSSRLYGWSYYIRAFDMVRDTPVREIGYGQWTSGDIAGGGKSQEVCGRHPHSLGRICNNPNNPPSDDDMNGEYKNCGSMDLDKLEECDAECCGDNNKCGIGGGANIEGGMGYWMYTLEHPHVKWMGMAGVTSYYKMIGRTYLDTRRQLCTSLGGAVRVSNNIVVGNDPMQFYSEENGVDGFLGYMITKTPIGKRSEEDDANYWTIIVDTDNFSGPIYYISAWFWDALSSWSPKSKTMANPEALITYAQTGFEGSIGAYALTADDGSKWIKTNRFGVPQDTIDGNLADSFTLYTGYSSYVTDWAVDTMEPILSGEGSDDSQKIASIRNAAQTERLQTPKCDARPFYNSWFEAWLGPWQLYVGTREQPDWRVFSGFGIGENFDENFDIDEYRPGSEAAYCHLRFELDTEKLECKSEFCEARNYFRLEDDDLSTNYVPTKKKKVPKNVRKIMDTTVFEPTRVNDGSNLGPPSEDEKPCFEKPGPAPANSRLYCTRLASGTWLGFQWYRFVDQPELNQVFASMDSSDRDAAKCYMQERIERLHEAMASGDEDAIPRWFRPPQGDENMPKHRVKFDPGYLVTPPDGLEKGFVPVVVWERNRERPIGCDVYLGEHTSEPNPFPNGYYDGYSDNSDEYRINEQCPANLESSGPFTFPGVVYPYPYKDYDSPVQGYDAPVKENVGDVLDSNPVICGLASDPP